MLSLFIAGLEKPSHRLITSVVMIALGTAAASYGEVNLSYIGLVIMLSSECFEAIRLVMTQMLLNGMKLHPSMLVVVIMSLVDGVLCVHARPTSPHTNYNHTVEGLMYLAPACVVWSTVGVLLFEWPTIQRTNALALVAAKPGVYLAAAAMGFGVNWLAYVVIQLASSLTLKVCHRGMAVACGMTLNHALCIPCAIMLLYTCAYPTTTTGVGDGEKHHYGVAGDFDVWRDSDAGAGCGVCHQLVWFFQVQPGAYASKGGGSCGGGGQCTHTNPTRAYSKTSLNCFVSEFLDAS